MSTIAVYGNLIHDHILHLARPFSADHSNECVSEEHRAGGLVNFCRALRLADKKLQIIAVGDVGNDQAGAALRLALQALGITPVINVLDSLPTSAATVICDDASRIGVVRWGACCRRRDWPPQQADWHHIMYLDKLHIDPTQMTGIVSADVCDGGIEAIQHQIPDLDYLFASEPKDINTNMRLLPTRRGLFLHGPGYHYVKNTSERLYQYQIEDGLNVLGAGDYLAAHAVLGLMTTGQLDSERIHQQTLALLRRQTCESTSFCH